MNRSQTIIREQTSKIALMSLLFALSITFSWLESMLVLPGLLPGIKLGLSNLVTMYCLFFLGGRAAYTLATMKSAFIMLTRGAVAGAMSLAGGICSVSVLLAVMFFSRRSPFHHLSLSIVGAISHNIGQLLLARLITSVFLYYYIPVLVLSGIIMGSLTGTVFQWILPYLPKRFTTMCTNKIFSSSTRKTT